MTLLSGPAENDHEPVSIMVARASHAASAVIGLGRVFLFRWRLLPVSIVSTAAAGGRTLSFRQRRHLVECPLALILVVFVFREIIIPEHLVAGILAPRRHVACVGRSKGKYEHCRKKQ